MEVDDIVTDEGIQNIYDSKRFTQPVYITGNIHVELLNGININEAYNNAILNENKTIEIYGDVVRIINIRVYIATNCLYNFILDI